MATKGLRELRIIMCQVRVVAWACVRGPLVRSVLVKELHVYAVCMPVAGM